MNVLANKRLDLDIINIISDLSAELQIKAFLVGGYVRDLILDRKSKDIDILIVGDGSNPVDALTCRCIGASTPRRLDTSKRQRVDSPTPSFVNASTH